MSVWGFQWQTRLRITCTIFKFFELCCSVGVGSQQAVRSESVSIPFAHTLPVYPQAPGTHQLFGFFPSRHCSQGAGFLGGPVLSLWWFPAAQCFGI